MTQTDFKTQPATAWDYIPRPGIEQLLQGAITRNLLFINAPAGAGKSSFIANHVTTSVNCYSWYNLGQEDDDPGLFLTTLHRAIARTLATEIPFPPFAANFLPTIEVYARRLFEILLSALGPGAVLVFDDYHHIGLESAANRLLLLMANMLGTKQSMIVISRTPVTFAGVNWAFEERILRLDWSHFRLSQQELAGFLERESGVPANPDRLAQLERLSNGRISSLLLYRDRDESITVLPENMDPVAIVGQTLGLEVNQWETLCRLAEFPEITTSVIEALVLDPAIIGTLQTLAEQGKLVARLQGGRGGYRLHDLLRDYLRREIRNRLAVGELERHLQKVAELLLSMGHDDEAIRILGAQQALPGITKLIRQRAHSWLRQGRYLTLRRALILLQDSEYEHNPWILFFQGAMCKFLQASKALALFQQALTGFQAVGDRNGEKLALGELLDTIQYYGEDFNLATPLLEQAQALIDTIVPQQVSTADVLLAGYAGVMYLLHQDEAIRSRDCLVLAAKLARGLEGFSLFASYINIYRAIACDTTGDFLEAEQAFEEAEILYAASPEHPPHRFMYNFLATIHETFAGRFQASLQRGQETLRYSQTWGLQHQDEHVLSRVIENWLALDQIEPTRVLFDRLETIPHRSTFSRAVSLQIEAHRGLLEVQPYQALQVARRSVELLQQIGAGVFLESIRTLLAMTLTELGEYPEAEQLLQQAITSAQTRGNRLRQFSAGMYLAWLYYRQGRPQQLRRVLVETLAAGREHGFLSTYYWQPQRMARLLSCALETGIEPDYANGLIAYHQLTAPTDVFSEHGWPWRVRIYTLGEMRVVIDDQRLTSHDWQGGKTLSLFLLLLVEGGTQVPVERVLDALWPESEGDKARQNLEFTVRRLRKVLRLPGDDASLVQRKAERISLDTRYCWIDLTAFEASLQYSEAVPAGKAVAARQLALNLYQGKLLPGREDTWLVNRRFQWRQRYLAAVEQQAVPLQSGSHWQELIALYRQATIVEPAMIALQAGLMAALVADEQFHEAITVYRHVRDQAKTGQAAKPSGKMQQLYQRIKTDG